MVSTWHRSLATTNFAKILSLCRTAIARATLPIALVTLHTQLQHVPMAATHIFVLHPGLTAGRKAMLPSNPSHMLWQSYNLAS